MSCEDWLESYVKKYQPVTPAEVYAAGKQVGFTRSEIKRARKWFGKYIDSEIREDKTLWRWSL